MSNQSEALRLADELEVYGGLRIKHPAAAELRLLHASVEALEQENFRRYKRIAALEDEQTLLVKQRQKLFHRIDALETALGMAVEALEQMRDAFLDVDGSHGSLERSAEEAADAALAAAKQTLNK